MFVNGSFAYEHPDGTLSVYREEPTASELARDKTQFDLERRTILAAMAAAGDITEAEAATMMTGEGR